MSAMPKVVIFISGEGSNMSALLAAQLPMQVVLVVSNNPSAPGLARAAKAGVDTWVLDHRQFDDRSVFDSKLIEKLKPLQPDWILLAGFMRRLTPAFVQAFPQKIINIHPSLLPKYPGLKTYERALAAGDNQVGSTVHWVTEDVDAGPILGQQSVAVLPTDTVSSLKEKVQKIEHKLYPQVVADLLSG